MLIAIADVDSSVTRDSPSDADAAHNRSSNSSLRQTEPSRTAMSTNERGCPAPRRLKVRFGELAVRASPRADGSRSLR